jgi:hypothetical protein
VEGSGHGLIHLLSMNLTKGHHEIYQDCRFLGRDSNPASPEYDSRASSLDETLGYALLCKVWKSLLYRRVTELPVN